MDKEKLIRAALDCGADKAVIIPVEQVVTNAVFRDICASNACGDTDGAGCARLMWAISMR